MWTKLERDRYQRAQNVRNAADDRWHYLILAVAVFGGMVLGTWSDRPTWVYYAAIGIPAVFACHALLGWWSGRRQLKRLDENQPPLEERDDPDLGRMAWCAEGTSWRLECTFDDDHQPVADVYLEGTRDDGPTASAKALWGSSAPRFSALWAEIRSNPEWTERELDGGASLSLEGVLVSPGQPLSGGEVIFWITTRTEPDGCFLVPVRDGRPLAIEWESHR